jgi:DNA-binding IclR family transcriptional regulator
MRKWHGYANVNVSEYRAPAMTPMTLINRKLYFGLDALQMRESTARLLARVQEMPADRPVVTLDALVEDFRVTAAASRPMIDEMVRHGLLQRLSERGGEYGVTEKFRRYADARIIGPLPRSQAKLVLSNIADLAWHFNRTAVDNKYEIDAVAAYGAYMSLEPEIPELAVAVTGRRRQPTENPAAGRATQALQGREQIKVLIEGLSNYLQTRFFQRLDDIPRPFSVIFKSSG